MNSLVQNISNSNEALIRAATFCESMHLKLPFIPSSELPKIVEYQEGIFGSKTDPFSLYDILAYVQEILVKPVDDYVMFGYAGHGINSWAMHYYIVKKNLAVFLQLPLGGVMITDDTAACDRINGSFAVVHHLIQTMSAADQKHLIESNKRLLLIESDFYGKGWGWIEGCPGEIGSEWHTDEPLFLEALSSIPIK